MVGNLSQQKELRGALMKIDLHTHSIHSDGTLSPSELLNLAKKNNIEILAITDHDDIEGSKKLIESSHQGIIVYSGVELSAKVEKGQMHILGYNIDLYNKKINQKLTELKEHSKKNIMLYIDQLKTTLILFFLKKILKNY
jgi:predicted metal-dependent phosphoesterase TrpH